MGCFKTAPETSIWCHHLQDPQPWVSKLQLPYRKITARRYKYILAATDYFSRMGLNYLSSGFHNNNSQKFFQVRIIYGFDFSETITVDYDEPFKSVALYTLYAKNQIKRIISYDTTHHQTNQLRPSTKPSAQSWRKWWTRIKGLGSVNVLRPCGLIEPQTEPQLKPLHIPKSLDKTFHPPPPPLPSPPHPSPQPLQIHLLFLKFVIHRNKKQRKGQSAPHKVSIPRHGQTRNSPEPEIVPTKNVQCIEQTHLTPIFSKGGLVLEI